ncbi:TRAP transporter substrate-binding protein [Neomoorella humiferrea]|uniref:TRAP transporter substrate-binding protein n=1 Tax=Neomoorella humiferrea TaxID=676965 RepID=UPI003D942B80
MKKGVILLILVFLAVTVLGCGSGNTQSAKSQEQKKWTIRLGTIQAPDNVVTQTAIKFAEYAKEKSGGRLDVQVLPASQLGSAKEQIESVKLGSQEMFTDATDWLGAYVPEYNILGLAFAFRDQDHVHKFLKGPEGEKMIEKLITAHGIRVLTHTLDRVPRNLLTTRPIKTIADLKGLKLRVPEMPAYVEAWKAMGAAPTPLALGELYTALEQGVVEGLEINTDSMYTQKFYEVAKNYASTGHVFATCMLIINEKFYQSLPDDMKKVLQDAATEAEKYNNETVKKLEMDSVEKMKAAGVVVNQINIDEMRNAVKDVAYKLEEKGIWPKGLYDKVQAIK